MRSYGEFCAVARALDVIGDRWTLLIVRELLPGPDIEIGPGLDYMQTGKPSYCLFDIGRARRELGYEPRYDLRHGVEDYLAILSRFGEGPG